MKLVKKISSILAICLLLTSLKAQTLIVDYDFALNLAGGQGDATTSALVQKLMGSTPMNFFFRLTYCKGKSSSKKMEKTDNKGKTLKFEGKMHDIFKDFLTGAFYMSNLQQENTIVKQTMAGFYTWKILDEYETIKGYKCRKAVSKDGDKDVIAWFTSDIAITEGPGCHFGLPGLILKVQTHTDIVEAKEITFEKTDSVINMPTAAKVVDYNEFLILQSGSKKN